MRSIAKRKPGNSKLVYDRVRKMIVVVDRQGNVVEETNLSISDE